MTLRPSGTIAVLADANVLYSRVLRDFLLYAADAELITILWSRAILGEATEHLAANIEGFTRESAARLIGAMNRAFPDAEMEPGTREYGVLEDVRLPDEDDRHVVAAALAGGATMLCTANVKDFPKRELAALGIRVITPDALLELLVAAYPVEMVHVCAVVVANLKGATRESTMAALRRAGAPSAAGLLVRALGGTSGAG